MGEEGRIARFDCHCTKLSWCVRNQYQHIHRIQTSKEERCHMRIRSHCAPLVYYHFAYCNVFPSVSGQPYSTSYLPWNSTCSSSTNCSANLQFGKERKNKSCKLLDTHCMRLSHLGTWCVTYPDYYHSRHRWIYLWKIHRTYRIISYYKK